MEIWKRANVVPVHKKNEKNLKGNYRPISLLPIFEKILEKLMYDSIYSHLVSCDLLNPNQSGFRPGDSTINQLISITRTIFKAFDCNPPPIAIRLSMFALYTLISLRLLTGYGMMG